MQSRYRLNKTILIPVGKIDISGELVIPEDANSLVLFAHGSGRNRFNPWNIFIAKELQKKNIGTFLFDQLTREEDEDYTNQFNVELLTERLILLTRYIAELQEFSDLNIGYFGTNIGTASALKAAVALPHIVNSVVSKGGRPDLAIDVASKLKVPTLLIVGGSDVHVLEINKAVFNVLKCEKKLQIMENVTLLCEEAGALQKVASLAGDWLMEHLKNSEIEVAQI